MKTTPVKSADLRASVLAVPPLCRNADFSLNRAENERLVRHIEQGGVTTLLYGGNANFYNIAPSEFAETLDLLEQIAAADSWIIPSAGPFYGTMIDQAAELSRRDFPTAMVLPTLSPAASAGVQSALRRFVERLGRPAVLYIKDPSYITPAHAAQLMDEKLLSFIKYAVVRPDPADDPYLQELTGLLDSGRIVSGIGEQPAIGHVRKFGLAGYTSGCVCVAPRLSAKMLAALSEQRDSDAESIRTRFQGLENLRNAHGPIPVLHHAIQLAGIADTGPMLPLLCDLPMNVQEEIKEAAIELQKQSP